MRYLSLRVLVLAVLATFGGSWLLQRVELVYGGPWRRARCRPCRWCS